MFFYIVLTPIPTTSGLWSTGNTRKYHQIDVYIYQCVHAIFIWSSMSILPDHLKPVLRLSILDINVTEES